MQIQGVHNLIAKCTPDFDIQILAEFMNFFSGN